MHPGGVRLMPFGRIQDSCKSMNGLFDPPHAEAQQYRGELGCSVGSVLDYPGPEWMHWAGHAAILILRQGTSVARNSLRLLYSSSYRLEHSVCGLEWRPFAGHSKAHFQGHSLHAYDRA